MHDARPSLFYLCGLVELEQNAPCAVALSCVTLVRGYLSLRSCLRSCGQVLGTPTKITVSIFLGRIFRFQQFLYRLEVTFENLLVQKASSHYHTTSGPLSASFSITSVVQYRCLGQYDRDSCCIDRAIHI